MEFKTRKTLMKKPRETNLELFRIITMLLIIAHHYVVNSGLTASDSLLWQDVTSAKSIFLLLFAAWGKTGINCFVMITGYFMCTSCMTAKKFAKLLLEVMFYKVVISLIFAIAGYEMFSVKDFLISLIPIRKIGTGFTHAYLMFMLFIPFLNILVQNMSEKKHIYLLILLTFMYVFLGTVPGFSVTMNYVSWFIVLYFVGSYIRLYPKKCFDNAKLWGFITLAVIIVASASVVLLAYVDKHITDAYPFMFVVDSNTLLAFLLGVSSFMFFKNLKIRYSKFVNSVAATCFGVLLIHANSDMMRNWLWVDVLKNKSMYESDF